MNFKPGIVSTMGLPEKVPVHHRDGTWSGQGVDAETQGQNPHRVTASPHRPVGPRGLRGA